MSGTLNLKKIKLGDNADTSKNFLIKTPAVADGTLTIEREDGTDVLTIDASGKVVFPGNAQTWQNVTASRALAGAYTNTTSLPIHVSITLNNLSSSGAYGARLVVDGVIVASQFAMQQTGAGNYFMTFYAIIPPGATYNLASGISVALTSWAEFR